MSKHTYHARFTLVNEIRIEHANICHRVYEVDFLEIDDLKITELIDSRALHDTKIELMKYLYNLIKSEDQLPSSVTTEEIILKNNQFIKEIEVDTDVILEVFDNKHDRTISEVSCFRTCEGICRRVLNDIKKEYGEISIDALKIHYEKENIFGSSNYKNIIELGALLKSLDEDVNDLEKSVEVKRKQELKKLMNETIEKNIIALRELAKYD